MLLFHAVVPPPQSNPNSLIDSIYPTMNPIIKPKTKQTVTWDYLSTNDTGLVDLGAYHIYIDPSAPDGPPDTITKIVRFGTDTGQIQHSLAIAYLPIPQLANGLPTTGKIMPNFTNTVIGVGPIYDAECTVLFTNQDVMVSSPTGEPILR